MEKLLSSSLYNRLFVIFLPEKQHLSPAKQFNLGWCLAQFVEQVSHVQRLCPRSIGPGLESGLGPFAVCQLPSLSSCFLSKSSPVLSIKPKGQKKNTWIKTQKPLTHRVFVLKNITTTVSPPDRDFSELSSRKQPPSPQVTESNSVLFTDGDYLIT